MDKKGIEIIKELLVELVINIEEVGPCELLNKVDECHVCGLIELKEKTEDYLSSLEKQKITTSQAWDKIVGNECLKRAIEVSLAGQHPITVIGNPENGGDYLEIILGDRLTFVKPCPCGNFKNISKVCECSISQIRKYKSEKQWMNAMKNPIIVELSPPTRYDYHIKQQETFQNVIDRINRKKDIPQSPFVGETFQLLKTAIERLNLSLKQVENIELVAKTVAELDNFDIIMPYHVSEAIQYQNIERNTYWWYFIPHIINILLFHKKEVNENG